MVYVENEIIGRRLRRIRLDFGYDYFEMGELLEISDGHYRKLERGDLWNRCKKDFIDVHKTGSRSAVSAYRKEQQRGRGLRYYI